jgi:2-iminobutanoate/2-iminopropanoate deaminase
MTKPDLRVEPCASFSEKRNVQVSSVVVHGGLVYASQMSPYDLIAGDARRFDVHEQMEIVLTQMKTCVEAAGSSLANVVQCSIYCNDPPHFPVTNDVYRGFFPTEPPVRKLIFVSGRHGPFHVKVDCIAAL